MSKIDVQGILCTARFISSHKNSIIIDLLRNRSMIRETNYLSVDLYPYFTQWYGIGNLFYTKHKTSNNQQSIAFKIEKLFNSKNIECVNNVIIVVLCNSVTQMGTTNIDVKSSKVQKKKKKGKDQQNQNPGETGPRHSNIIKKKKK